MQGNNKLRVFSGNTSNYIADANLDGAPVQTGAVNGGVAASNLYNSLSLTTTLACTSLIDFVAQYNPSVTFGQTTPIETWITAVGNAIASKVSVDNIVDGTTPAANATNVTTNINGNAISDIFESNGTTVKNATNSANATNATNATYATYASSDTSKGTIEERLTNLGFKQGSVELNTALTGYSYIQVTKNTILRQGNYVLLNLTLKSNGSGTFGGLNQEIGTISTAFLPSQTQTYNAIVSSECSDYSAFEQKYVTGIRNSSCVITISQNGNITETQGATFYNTNKNGTTRFYSMEINIGYEASPLEQI